MPPWLLALSAASFPPPTTTNWLFLPRDGVPQGESRLTWEQIFPGLYGCWTYVRNTTPTSRLASWCSGRRLTNPPIVRVPIVFDNLIQQKKSR